MKRRSFLRNSTLAAFAVSNSGFIQFDGTRYVGDCETTTDILGPFYRPNSPVRTDLFVAGEAGEKITLEGIVKHRDCTTACKNAKVEIWHCNAAGEYDNDTNEFRHRGTTYSDADGKYHFNTILPVPYKVTDNYTRPAHFHMMITADGYQQLVTQLYFEGDSHLKEDSYASSTTAAKRILKVKTLPDKSKKVIYDIGMSKKLSAEKAAVEKLTGVYVAKEKNFRFVSSSGQLMIDEIVLSYIGNNTFANSELSAKYQFNLLSDGSILLRYKNDNKPDITAMKTA